MVKKTINWVNKNFFEKFKNIDTLKPEIEVEESRSGRVLVTVRVMDGKKDLYERNGSVQTGDGAGYNPRQPRIRSTDSNSRTVCVSEGE